MSLQLFVLSGRDVGRSFQVEEAGEIGRGESCAMRLTDRSVSREHARLERRDDGWYVVDTGSRNGLWVGGKRVGEGRLSDLSEFRLGEVRMRVRFAEASEPPTGFESAPDPSELEKEEAARLESVTISADRMQLEVELEEDFEEEIELAAAHAPPQGEGRRDQELHRAVRESREGGLWTGDLGQRPGWIRFLLVLVALGVAAAAAWGAFRLVVGLREGL